MSQDTLTVKHEQATQAATSSFAATLASVTQRPPMSAHQAAAEGVTTSAAPVTTKAKTTTFITIDEERRELTANEITLRKNIKSAYGVYDAEMFLVVIADSDEAVKALQTFAPSAQRFSAANYKGKITLINTLEGKPVWQMSADDFARAIKTPEGTRAAKAAKVSMGDFVIESEIVKTVKDASKNIVLTLTLSDDSGVIRYADGRSLNVKYTTRGEQTPSKFEDRKNPEISLDKWNAQQAMRVWIVDAPAKTANGEATTAGVRVFYKIDDILQWAVKPE